MIRKQEVQQMVLQLDGLLRQFIRQAPAFDGDKQLAGQIGVAIENLDNAIRNGYTLDQNTSLRKPARTYHGWIVCESAGEGYNDVIYVEFVNGMNARQRTEVGRGDAGCTLAVEFFDERVGTAVQLEKMLRGCYRVFTE